MDKEAFLAGFSSKKTLGGPDMYFINTAQGAIINSPSTISDPTSNDMASNSMIETQGFLINEATPGRKVNSQNNTATINKGYFIAPTTGWNWGTIHNFNAIDIANECGTPIFASAEGLIVENETNGWNSGYGNYIKIKHANETITLYAHLKNSNISWGQYVFQGDLIGYMGNTGNTDGPTGCHLHFEVRGGKNPLAK